MFRRFLLKATAVVLAFSMAFAMPVDVAFANEGDYEVKYAVPAEEVDVGSEYAVADSTGQYKYEVVDNTAKIISYVGKEKNIVIPENLDGYTVTTIGYNSFKYKGAEVNTITIPATVNTIEEGGFGYINGMTDYIVDSGNTTYKVINHSLVTIDGKTLIAYPGDRPETTYTVPDGVERIGREAFAKVQYLRKIVLPDSVKSMGFYAFSRANITEICLGNGLVNIDYGVFEYSKLESIVIPDSVKNIRTWAFAHCSNLTSVKLGKNLETIGEKGFYSAENVEEITIPASVMDIGKEAFAHMYSLEKINVEEGNENYKIENEALLTMNGESVVAYPLNSQTTTLIIPETVKYIDDSAFACAKNLQNIVFPDGLFTIGSSSFSGCIGLKELKLPNTVYELDSGTFNCCASLERISIPSNVANLKLWVLKDCENLKSVFIPSEIKSIDTTAFSNSNAIEEIYFVGSYEEWTEIENVSNVAEFANAKVYFLGNLKDFVDRMYSVALGREYDAVGLNGWVRQLVEETHDGAGLAKEFVLGEEFALRNLNDEQYVDTLYTTFFNREADASGKELWLATLAAGQSREYVLSQFVNSDEFTLLCLDFGINRGVMFTNGTVAAPGLPQFVIRLYGQVLGRAAEKEGLYNWSEALVTKAVTAEEAAVNFFMSQEYELKNVDSTTFVTDCYSVFMDREADETGLAFWVACLDEQGVSRQWVISEFAKSAEFKGIAAKYGL